MTLRENTSTPGVIQVPMAHEDVVDGFESDPRMVDPLRQGPNRQPRVDQNHGLVCPEEGRIAAAAAT